MSFQTQLWIIRTTLKSMEEVAVERGECQEMTINNNSLIRSPKYLAIRTTTTSINSLKLIERTTQYTKTSKGMGEVIDQREVILTIILE